MITLSPDLAATLAATTLSHVTREYPNKLDHVLTGPNDGQSPQALHPVFYGSFDWHSCVHGYWQLARIYRRFPNGAQASAIRRLFDTHLSSDKVSGECAYFDRPSSAGFERPYGWAWLLKLASELALHQAPEAKGWSLALQPLAARIVERFETFLPRATYPVRAGTHGNTAFAVRLALDYANDSLRAQLRQAALSWYGMDADCQAWEPSGDEFLSPALIEAECMRAVLPSADFHTWFARFLPRINVRQPATLFKPAAVSDRTDGKIVHLDGLNLSRSWCWRSLARFTSAPAEIEAVAEAHVSASLPHVHGHYMGAHWLASFAVLALDQANDSSGAE